MPDLDLGDLVEAYGVDYKRYLQDIQNALKNYQKDYFAPSAPKELSRGTVLPEVQFTLNTFDDSDGLQAWDVTHPGLVVTHPCDLEPGRESETAQVAPIVSVPEHWTKEKREVLRDGAIDDYFWLPPTANADERMAALNESAPMPCSYLRSLFGSAKPGDLSELSQPMTWLLAMKLTRLFGRP
ncbi:MAG: hypothetical protein ACRDHX_01160 [Chloroflexota bacterium]